MSAAVALTFDNLGEAAEIEAGLLDPDTPRGSHRSVATGLPKLLDLLDELGLRATFFVEAVNTRDYPLALGEIAARGHEIGFHAWRHERWGELEPDAELELIERSLGAYASAGIEVSSFRPPGGALNANTVRWLRERGIRWCSALGGKAGVDDAAMVQLPFRWELVDATYLYEHFGAVRTSLDMPEHPFSAAQAGARLRDSLASDPDPFCRTLVLHPFLAAEGSSWPMYEQLLRDLASRASTGRLRVSAGDEIAAELASRHDAPVAGRGD